MTFAKSVAQILMLLFVCAGPVFAGARIAPKQLIILKPGLDAITGTWLAAVMNDGDKPARLRLPVLLPRETEDFKPMEGVNPADVKLEDDGPYVEKDFGPGVNVVSFGFVVGARQGTKDLSFAALSDVGEFTVMTPRGMLSVQGENMQDGGTDIQDLQTYSIWVSKQSINQGDTVRLRVSGIPEGRQRLWFLGGIFALALILAAVYLTWRSRKESQLAASSVI